MNKPSFDELPNEVQEMKLLIMQLISEVKSLKDLIPAKNQIKEPEEDLGKNISAKEAARLIGFNVHTVYVKAAAGDIPSFKMGGKVLFDKSDILDWIKKHKRKSKFEIEVLVDEAIASHKK